MSIPAVARSPRMIRVLTCCYSFGYLLMAAACLVRWGSAAPWSPFDPFSGGYLLFRAVGSAHSLLTAGQTSRSREVMEEWWGMNSDPGGIRRVMVLMALDLGVFVEYAHGQPLDWRAWPALQVSGLILYAASIAGQVWTDHRLARFFATVPRDAAPMKDGPYRFVRHPRYSSALAGKLAFALIFANALGWLMAMAWAVLLLRKVQSEEAHLQKRFGSGYVAYQRATAKLVPGLY